MLFPGGLVKESPDLCRGFLISIWNLESEIWNSPLPRCLCQNLYRKGGEKLLQRFPLDLQVIQELCTLGLHELLGCLAVVIDTLEKNSFLCPVQWIIRDTAATAINTQPRILLITGRLKEIRFEIQIIALTSPIDASGRKKKR